ncbi:hypothetical protein SLEP1_g10033 [Rubroshorea leprosula]|uniref:Uncharacterized protein n=1 Tax=Rubroshorea leprosula TaxID=152421 RepID=A0AAV5IG82_9ROSI|nr:hypothetical protein SLEP1_g10033 [Rubroshorea leprosula]
MLSESLPFLPGFRCRSTIFRSHSLLVVALSLRPQLSCPRYSAIRTAST